jgi:hypothetical protein
MVDMPTMRRRIFLRLLRWAIVTRSHPIPASIVSAVLVFIAVAASRWRYFYSNIPKWSERFGNAVLVLSQNHPHLSRILHFILNAVPDAVPLFLGLAGLVYLMPNLAKRIEDSKPLRAVIATFCILFCFLAIAVNAINRESQEFKDSQSGERMGMVLKDVTGIQDQLNPKNTQINEAERRSSVLTTLRDEYILLPGPVDPDILSGKKQPPASWVNARLQQMGQDFHVKDVPGEVPRSQIVQVAPAPQKAKLLFSFYSDAMNQDQYITNVYVPVKDGKVKVSVAAVVVGDVTAQGVNVWFRVCDVCSWAATPAGFSMLPEEPRDRSAKMGDMLPNVVSPRWDLEIALPEYPRSHMTVVSAFYGCNNCAPVDPSHGQILWINQPNPFIRPQLRPPSGSYIPAPDSQ